MSILLNTPASIGICLAVFFFGPILCALVEDIMTPTNRSRPVVKFMKNNMQLVMLLSFIASNL